MSAPLTAPPMSHVGPRPQLAPGTPLVWRQEDTLQVGFGLAIRGAPRSARAALTLLDGSRTVAQAAAIARVDPTWLQGCVQRLAGAGAVRATPRCRAAVVGSGAFAELVTSALGEFALDWEPRAQGPAPDVAVLTDGIAAERGLGSVLTRRGIPHLYVGSSPGGAVVGPFVVPGQDACQRCVDLTLAERDPAWPRVAAQLESGPPTAGAAAAHWAAGLAAAHIEVFAEGRVPESSGRTWELAAGELRVRRWPRRPDCDCVAAVA